jgi:adenosylmethionine-8-amino-7-oxononanoate aminotransferase
MRDVWNTQALIESDKKHLWHPFTPMRDWCAEDHTPLILVRGHGAWLEDSEGRRYLDGNSSIWTNIHGHAHPKINHAIQDQLNRVAHVSFLGIPSEFSNRTPKASIIFVSAKKLTDCY